MGFDSECQLFQPMIVNPVASDMGLNFILGTLENI